MDIKLSKKRKPSAVRGSSGRTSLSSVPSKKTTSLKTRNKRRKLLASVFNLRNALVVTNLAVLLIAGFIVVAFSDGNAANYAIRNDVDRYSNPLDELSASDVAVNIAQATNLAEVDSVITYADTIKSELDTFSSGSELARMPQILSADIKTLDDIEEYITQPGDTVGILAERFGVTSDSIKWSNDLTGDALTPGIRLLIPPMNGMIYTIRSGDTPDKVAQLYQIPRERLIVFNDLEVSSMIPGRRIFLPNAQRPTPASSFSVRYGYNGYDPGWCTYYAAARGGAPSGWGHARTWAVNATRTPGWYVSKIPVPGAIAQTTGIAGDRVGGSWGHVGIVEQVKEENGEYYIKYSDMNGLAGFNRVGHSDWVPALSKYQNFIYRIE